MRTRHGRGRGARADCGEHFVVERLSTDGFIPDPRLFLLNYLNWGGGGGTGKKRNACCFWEMRVYLCCNSVWLAFSCGGGRIEYMCCSVAILVRWGMYVYIHSCWCGVDILVRWEMYVYIYSSWCACAGVALVDTLVKRKSNLSLANQRCRERRRHHVSNVSARDVPPRSPSPTCPLGVALSARATANL